MTNSISAADFVSNLKAEHDALKSLVTLLEAEQQTLINGHVDQLLEISDKKTKAVQEVSKLASARKDVLLAHDVEIKAGGIIGWLKVYAPNSLSAWQDIQKLVEQMQYLNRTNGTLIQTKVRYNQQALTVLFNAANGAHGLYGADGQPHLPSSSRILGSV